MPWCEPEIHCTKSELGSVSIIYFNLKMFQLCLTFLDSFEGNMPDLVLFFQSCQRCTHDCPACAASPTNVLHQPLASHDHFRSSAQTLSDVTEQCLVFHGVDSQGLSTVSYSSAAQGHLVLVWAKERRIAVHSIS